MAAFSNTYRRATRAYADAAAASAVQGIVTTSTIAALEDAGNAINTTGKFKNKFVEDENDRVYRALGADATSDWRPLDDQSGASDITPA